MRTKRILGIALLIWLSGVSPASACGVCVAAALDLVIPPVFFWSALSLTWFLSMGILSSATGNRFRGQPSALWALGISGLAALLGGSFLGPIAVLPLALFPMYASIRALAARPVDFALARIRKVVLIIGLVHVVASSVGIVLLVHTLRTRTAAAYVCEWSGTGPGRSRFQTFRKQEPGSIEAYRYIVEYGSGWVVAAAAERLGSIGDPAQDTGILRRARVRANGDPEASTAINTALKALEERRGPKAF